MFTLPEYCAPDFSAPLLQNAPSVRTAPAPADGAAPAGYHATGMYPEYYKVDGVWRLAEKSRMDCVPVLAPDGELRIVEFRNLVQGDSVVLGRTDDGTSSPCSGKKGQTKRQSLLITTIRPQSLFRIPALQKRKRL